MVDHKLRQARGKRQSFRQAVRIAENRLVDLMDELDPVGTSADGPLARVNDLVGVPPAVVVLFGFLNNSHPDPEETVAAIVIAEPLVVSAILLDRAGDAVVEVGIVGLLPFSEVLVARVH